MKGKLLVIRLAAISCLISVALGAMGAHALKDILTENQRTEVWETAVFYQFVHAVALIALLWSQSVKFLKTLTYLWCGGAVVFSGSLYVLAITNIKVLGAITPIGGVMFLVGWALVIFQAKKLLADSSD